MSKTWSIKTKKNTRNLAIWTGAWLVTMAVASFGPKFIWDYNSIFSLLSIGVNILVGIGMIKANIQYLKGLDEMQQRLSLEAMGLALGVGVVGGLSYSLLDISNVISYDAEISHLVILIGLTYLVGIIVGNIRYK